ncbi:MAG: uroporphyrinogen-III C-methyltransferase [Bacteroidia bacterium]|nr:uroporphyrinogen-III C-methyltransferase [Bacteroidia bacterium]
MKRKQPKLTIAGAGPGDPGLITLKAVTALRNADVILYDALVNPDLLKHAAPGVKRLYVGKRDHRHTLTQEQINSLIVKLALEHGHVVRLKGGDPFVFGRGQEELAYAASFNIPTEYIPGISSSVGVPGIAGIPVTHRGSSESFWVITGTTRSGKISEDVFKAAQTDATIIILMGVSHLAGIVNIFQTAGKTDLPVAVIQDGSLPTQKEAVGVLSNIEERVKQAGVGSPAVIVIGKVVKSHPDFREKVRVATRTAPTKSSGNTVLLHPPVYN